MVPHVNIPFLGGFHTDISRNLAFLDTKNLVYAFCNFLSSNSLFRSNSLGVTIQTKQIRARVEIIPSYLNDYILNQKQSSLGVTIQTKQIRARVEIIPSYLNDYILNQKQSSLSLFLKYAKSCVRGKQSPTSENIIQRIGQ